MSREISYRRYVESLRTLELEPGATFADVRRAYRRLMLEWHPDRHALDPTLKLEAEERTKQINQVFGWIRDNQWVLGFDWGRSNGMGAAHERPHNGAPAADPGGAGASSGGNEESGSTRQEAGSTESSSATETRAEAGNDEPPEKQESRSPSLVGFAGAIIGIGALSELARFADSEHDISFEVFALIVVGALLLLLFGFLIRGMFLSDRDFPKNRR